jgi:hypothetical protein
MGEGVGGGVGGDVAVVNHGCGGVENGMECEKQRGL